MFIELFITKLLVVFNLEDFILQFITNKFWTFVIIANYEMLINE